jgi:hypothetical protein
MVYTIACSSPCSLELSLIFFYGWNDAVSDGLMGSRSETHLSFIGDLFDGIQKMRVKLILDDW